MSNSSEVQTVEEKDLFSGMLVPVDSMIESQEVMMMALKMCHISKGRNLPMTVEEGLRV